jgi:hypothetical protein
MESVSKNWFVRLKDKWGITTWLQFWVIFLVFAVTGSSSVFVGKKVLGYFNLSYETLGWVWYPVRIISITIIYQVLLLFWGTIFGQFQFFWNFEKKMFSRFGKKKN